MKKPYNFTLKDIFNFAKTKGYNETEVVVEVSDDIEEMCHRVWFGVEDIELWIWDFDNLDEMTVDYQHLTYGD